jgi:hypothetical protein
MKRIIVLPIDFLGQTPMFQPADAVLHDLAIEFCQKQLAEPVNLTKFQKVWAAVEMDNGNPMQVIGVAGWINKIDIPLFRASGSDSVKASTLLIDRMRSYFQDQGCRGAEAFIHISTKETPEQKCDEWQRLLEYVKAEPGDRWSVTI